jgi:alpha-amylase/alpha-mannosidase (GH57 family)
MSARKLRLAFLWHMHQPLYQEEVGGKFLLPWVRLHALKGYYDMPSVLEGHPRAKVTFNLTPSLLFQIEQYWQDDIQEKDEYLRLSLKPASELTGSEREFILANFFMINWDQVVKPHPRYSELLNLRGESFQSENLHAISTRFTDQDILDLQVLFNLCWCGFTLRNSDSKVRELTEKQRHYTEDDKVDLIAVHLSVMKDLFDKYRKLQDRGQIELTTTPFYHPILPLLYNGGEGEGHNWREDADTQVKKGLDYFESHFNHRPLGMWPSEGSVSESVTEITTANKIQWIGTDEEILAHSLDKPFVREAMLYTPYQFKNENSDTTIFFRDKKLSDLIGFSYSKSDPQSAVDDFISRLRDIFESTEGEIEDPVASVILDGENAWEFYSNDGRDFLNQLYEQLNHEPWIEMVRFQDVLETKKPLPQLDRLFSGSWINHNFQIWHGHSEDLEGWTYLSKTREFLMSQDLSREKSQAAWEELYAAQGSDWFWWFGDEFMTTTADIFDYLFRNHLINVYRIAGARPPGYLFKPIKKNAVTKSYEKNPTALINPIIDGELSSFYEWAGAGRFKAEEPQGAMHKGDRWISELFYGYDQDNLYFRIDFDPEQSRELIKTLTCLVSLNGSDEYECHINLSDEKAELYKLSDGEKTKIKGAAIETRFQSIIELSIPFEVLGVIRGNELEFRVKLLRDLVPIEEVPTLSMLSVFRPDSHTGKALWAL